jgi:hypothetical protein
MKSVYRSKALRGVVVANVLALALFSSPLIASASGTLTSPPTRVARTLLNMVILPATAKQVHPATTVVCQCAGTPGDSGDLFTTHRYYVVPGTPAFVEEFLATHVPKGGVEGGEGSSGSALWISTAFPANGPHLYLRQLAYSMTARNASTSWLRIDSQIVWVPRRSSSQFVTKGVVATATGYKSVGLSGSSGPTKVKVTGTKLSTLLRAINSLPLGPQNACMEGLTGFDLKIYLKTGVTLQIYNGFCGGPFDTVSAQVGNRTDTRYSLADTSCSLFKDVVSLFGTAPIPGTRGALRNCEAWIKRPVA